MRCLFLHQNFPGQFVHIAQALQANTANQLMAIADGANRTRLSPCPVVYYTLTPEKLGSPPQLAQAYAHRMLRGEAVARVLATLQSSGFVPDIIIGHSGWGETLFVKDVYPTVPLIAYSEFYYHPTGIDVGFDAEFNSADQLGSAMSVRSKNGATLMAAIDADYMVAPTAWQKSVFPAVLHDKVHRLHEGVDTDRLCPNPNATFTLANGLTLGKADEVLTFVNRNLEPYRGYHRFMRALPDILMARPKAHAIIVGGDEVSYGAAAPKATTWKQRFLSEVQDGLPPDRVHFVGKIPYKDFISLMQISRAHVYLTYPFVLSWSMLEAMSIGALVIGSDTAPVREAIEHGKTGLLVDFFDQAGLVKITMDALANPDHFMSVRSSARKHIQTHYDLKRIALPRWLKFIEDMAMCLPAKI